MSKIKIYLDEGEDEYEVESQLLKALLHHSEGDVHLEESFDDPAMVDVSQRMDTIHEQVYREMIAEITELIEEDLGDN